MSTTPHLTPSDPASGPRGGAVPATTVTPARHWVGLHGVAEIPTPQFKRAQAQLRRVVSIGGIAAISGRPGSGKTFSVDYFLHRDPVMAGKPFLWIEPSVNATTKALAIILCRELDVKVSNRDSEFIVVEELMPALRESNAVIAVDEAQRLSTGCLQQLRYFHDRCFPTRPGDPSGWTLLLSGSSVDRSLGSAAELASRVAAWVRFDKMESKELLQALRAWHPLLAQMDPRLLLLIDQQRCQGVWRDWAQFLAAYIDAHGRAPATTDSERERLVRIALAAVKRQAT